MTRRFLNPCAAKMGLAPSLLPCCVLPNSHFGISYESQQEVRKFYHFSCLSQLLTGEGARLPLYIGHSKFENKTGDGIQKLMAD